MKYRSTLFTQENIEKIRGNSIGTSIREHILTTVKHWKDMSYDDLWELIYGIEIRRARFVHTDGRDFPDGCCPACGKKVHLDGWQYDVFKEPWKVWCPHCGEKFPKNDFERYYRSGMDEHHEFRQELADRSLLYNTEAPDPDDPMHMFGVDDGNGYFQENEGWLFISSHIMNHVWYITVCEGITMLARAYILTGDRDYAVRCGIILDRIADIFPKYNFFLQGYNFTYKVKSERGYTTGWCEIIRQLFSMLLAYDAIFEAIREDETFISYIAEKSEKYKTPYRKNCFEDIQTNIENRIFGDAMVNQWKTESNPPWPDLYKALVMLVLTEWPVRPDDIPYGVYFIMWHIPEKILKTVIEDSTKIDGLSGEKSLAGYSVIAVDNMAKLLSWFSLYDDKLLGKMLKLYPGILDGIRFLMNSWLLKSYFPGCGDTSSWVISKGIVPTPGYTVWESSDYRSFRSSTDTTILYSYEGFLWKLYKLTKDMNILRFMYNAKNYDMDKLFTTDLTLDESPAEIQRQFKELIDENGSELEQHSMNAEKWKLAILHSGKGANKRAAFLDYDSGGVHGHNDSMNIGLYAKGANLLPDIGYPPVVSRAGGFHSEFAFWYRSAASHNTAIVDGVEHRDYCWYQRDVKGRQGLYSETGETVLWGTGSWVKAAAADDPGCAGADRFERLLAIVDLSEQDCYFFDIFRIKGGKEHVKLTNGGIDCDLDISGLRFQTYDTGEDPYGAGFIRDINREVNIPYTFDAGFKFIRDTRVARNADDIWHAEWKYLTRYNKAKLLPPGKDISLQYRDLTQDKAVISYTSFFDALGLMTICGPEALKKSEDQPEIMRPGVAVMRSSEDTGLETVFIGIYEGSDNGAYSIVSAKRLMTEGNDDPNKGSVAFEIETAYGTDLILAVDVQDKKTIVQKDRDVKTDAVLSVLREHKDGSVKLMMIQGSFYEYGERKIVSGNTEGIYEAEL